MVSLLPNNATPLELALEAAVDRSKALPVEVEKTWNPDECPMAFLPWLAKALSVDVWDDNWPDGIKRQALKQSLYLHRIKGTVGAVERMVKLMGYEGATVTEGIEPATYGEGFVVGKTRYAGDFEWACYSLNVTLADWQGIDGRSQKLLTKAVESVAPAHCELYEVSYRSDLTDTVNISDHQEIRIKDSSKDYITKESRYGPGFVIGETRYAGEVFPDEVSTTVHMCQEDKIPYVRTYGSHLRYGTDFVIVDANLKGISKSFKSTLKTTSTIKVSVTDSQQNITIYTNSRFSGDFAVGETTYGKTEEGQW